MSHQDSESESQSDGSITPSSASSDDYPPEGYVQGRDCHHLGHLEAIPVNREGTLVQIHHAYVWDRATEWIVLNTNKHGPRYDYCYKLPGPGNSWIAKTTEGTPGATELFETVQKHKIKGYKYHIYECVRNGDITLSSWIIESYLEEEKREKVPEGRQQLWTLKERLGFEVRDLRLRRCRHRPLHFEGQLWAAYQNRDEDEDEYDYDDEDERMDRGEFSDEESDEGEVDYGESDDDEMKDDEGEGEDEE